MSTSKQTFYATRSFKDAGTGKSFASGEPVEAEAGELGNYAAAGLVSDKRPEPAKPADAA